MDARCVSRQPTASCVTPACEGFRWRSLPHKVVVVERSGSCEWKSHSRAQMTARESRFCSPRLCLRPNVHDVTVTLQSYLYLACLVAFSLSALDSPLCAYRHCLWLSADSIMHDVAVLPLCRWPCGYRPVQTFQRVRARSAPCRPGYSHVRPRIAPSIACTTGLWFPIVGQAFTCD